MASTYKKFYEIEPNLFSNIILGKTETKPEEEPAGLMAPTTSLRPQARPANVDAELADSEAIENTILGVLADQIGKSSGDREAVAKAVAQKPKTQEEIDLSEWESMPPPPDKDQTRNALGEAPEVTPNFEETASRLTKDLMRDFDLSETQAAAFVGNLAVESANFQTLQEIDPLIEGSRGGFGYAQWTGDRRVAFESWARDNGLDPTSYEANYGYLKKELSETDDIIGNIGRNTIKRLREMNDLNQATSFVMEYFLRPGVPHESRRQESAQQILGLMGRQE